MNFSRDINPPNILSALRVTAAPAMLACAVTGSRRWFVTIFVFALLSDSIDGFIARRRHETTVTGARLDSLGDLMIVLTLLPGVWFLWPAIVRRESVFIAAGLLSYLVPSLIGMCRFGRMTSYHTWGAKVMAVLMGISLLLLFLEVSSLPFRACIPLAVLEGVEEMAITAVLPEWRADVPSLYHALKIRSAARARGGA